LDFGGMPPEDARTFPIRGERLRKSLHGRLAVRGWHTVVPRLKDARLSIGFEVCGKAYLFRDHVICPNIKDNPEYCDAKVDGVCGWETWYYLDPESARGREARYWEPQEVEALEHFEEAVWECVAEQAARFGITKSWEFLWGGSLIVLAMMKTHPLLRLDITEASNPEDPPWDFYDLVPDYVSATKYAFEAFRRMRQVKGKPQERQADVTTKPTVPGVQAQPSAEEDRSSGGAQFPAANSNIADGSPMAKERAPAILALLNPLVLIETGLSNLYVRMRMLREENPHGVFSDTPPTKMTFAQQQEFQNRILAWTNPVQDAIKEARAKCTGIAMHVTGVIDNPAMWETDLRANLRLLGEQICSFHQCGNTSTFAQEEQHIIDLGCQLYCQGTRLEDAYETVEAASSTGKGAAHEAAGVPNTATASPDAATASEGSGNTGPARGKNEGEPQEAQNQQPLAQRQKRAYDLVRSIQEAQSHVNRAADPQWTDFAEDELAYAEAAVLEYLVKRFGEQDDAKANWPGDWHECPEAYELWKAKIAQFNAKRASALLDEARRVMSRGDAPTSSDAKPSAAAAHVGSDDSALFDRTPSNGPSMTTSGSQAPPPAPKPREACPEDVAFRQQVRRERDEIAHNVEVARTNGDAPALLRLLIAEIELWTRELKHETVRLFDDTEQAHFARQMMRGTPVGLSILPGYVVLGFMVAPDAHDLVELAVGESQAQVLARRLDEFDNQRREFGEAVARLASTWDDQPREDYNQFVSIDRWRSDLKHSALGLCRYIDTLAHLAAARSGENHTTTIVPPAGARSDEKPPTRPAEPGQTKRQPWSKDATEYLPLTEAVKLTDGYLSLQALSKKMKPTGEMRYMQKGQRCKVHIADFYRYIKSQVRDPEYHKLLVAFMAHEGKGDLRFAWKCSNCGAVVSRTGDRCPKRDCPGHEPSSFAFKIEHVLPPNPRR
jgi:hypothetical protein